MPVLKVYKMGLADYGRAYKFQEELLLQRIGREIPDSLLLLEHPPTLTIGKEGDLENLLVSGNELKKRGIALFPVDRGGSITWHGPGQLVGYPILDLRERDRDIRKFIDALEEVIIRTLADLSIQSTRDDEHVGVWVGQEKIAAIGVRINRWVTKHGFALNVNNDLSHFSLINPCGITDRGVTSIVKLLGRDVSMETVTEKLLINFSDVFEYELDIAARSTDDLL
ncbi:MAG: lipoyl(octanoyl) transferase LipB [Deltaproteobacteria bacterium]|nr:lipoyl(octanoyl) transferase LipB [Deltaproteobacteria bacterium]MBW2050762.1 lipoyl(octanoyl) transferase LipB [Deltaproteobacteria bacterium]MBW2141372.1 lipoyl(octanoyl) transferase LipB [Deltaproteobacteria bacterium]MBW2321978.1 lipoyl(octanoyl) transferase LipB [Deltaproteobacteria bacterium]